MAKPSRLPLDMIAPSVCFLSSGRIVALSELQAPEKKVLPVEQEQRSEDRKSVNLHSKKKRNLRYVRLLLIVEPFFYWQIEQHRFEKMSKHPTTNLFRFKLV